MAREALAVEDLLPVVERAERVLGVEALGIAPHLGEGADLGVVSVALYRPGSLASNTRAERITAHDLPDVDRGGRHRHARSVEFDLPGRAVVGDRHSTGAEVLGLDAMLMGPANDPRRHGASPASDVAAGMPGAK